jgi:hypothetical protein
VGAALVFVGKIDARVDREPPNRLADLARGRSQSGCWIKGWPTNSADLAPSELQAVVVPRIAPESLAPRPAKRPLPAKAPPRLVRVPSRVDPIGALIAPRIELPQDNAAAFKDAPGSLAAGARRREAYTSGVVVHLYRRPGA